MIGVLCGCHFHVEKHGRPFIWAEDWWISWLLSLSCHCRKRAHQERWKRDMKLCDIANSVASSRLGDVCNHSHTLTQTYCQRWHVSRTSVMTSNNRRKKLRILTPSIFYPGLCATTVSFSGQSARKLASDIVHLTSAMTSARLTVLGRAHFHSLTPLCHSPSANPSFPPFISISHPSITHHLLSLGLSSSPSCGCCSFSEHLSLSFFFALLSSPIFLVELPLFELQNCSASISEPSGAISSVYSSRSGTSNESPGGVLPFQDSSFPFL